MMPKTRRIRIISWNVNGIRASLRKGLLTYIDEWRPDILGIQEVRALPDQIPLEQFEERNLKTVFRPALRKGYSGVALLSGRSFTQADDQFNVARFDDEGRVVAADFGDFVLFNVYFPNGSGNRDNSRVPYKLEFYDALLNHVQRIRENGREIIVMGDFNTAHHPIDLARPGPNKKNSGFLSIERDAFQAWIDQGFVDSFRHLHPDQSGRYSWWSYIQNARGRNVGWRIDYILCTPGLAPKIKVAEIDDHVFGSDHCPVRLELDL